MSCRVGSVVIAVLLTCVACGRGRAAEHAGWYEIARALATGPRLLLLDEPAAGLRHLEKQQLAKLLRELRDGGMSVLLVEHDMGFVMNLADRVVVLDFGTKIAEGAPEAVKANPDVIRAYLGAAA